MTDSDSDSDCVGIDYGSNAPSVRKPYVEDELDLVPSKYDARHQNKVVKPVKTEDDSKDHRALLAARDPEGKDKEEEGCEVFTPDDLPDIEFSYDAVADREKIYNFGLNPRSWVRMTDTRRMYMAASRSVRNPTKITQATAADESLMKQPLDFDLEHLKDSIRVFSNSRNENQKRGKPKRGEPKRDLAGGSDSENDAAGGSMSLKRRRNEEPLKPETEPPVVTSAFCTSLNADEGVSGTLPPDQAKLSDHQQQQQHTEVLKQLSECKTLAPLEKYEQIYKILQHFDEPRVEKAVKEEDSSDEINNSETDDIESARNSRGNFSTTATRRGGIWYAEPGFLDDLSGDEIVVEDMMETNERIRSDPPEGFQEIMDEPRYELYE